MNFITISEHLKTQPEQSVRTDIYCWNEHRRQYWKIGTSDDFKTGKTGMLKFNIDSEKMFVKL